MDELQHFHLKILIHLDLIFILYFISFILLYLTYLKQLICLFNMNKNYKINIKYNINININLIILKNKYILTTILNKN